MSELRVTVDHLRLHYNGPFDANGLYRHISAWLKERGWDFIPPKTFEHETQDGKQMEWQIKCWKRLTDTVRYWPKIRILIKDYRKIDAMVDNKKAKVGTGDATIYIDAYLDIDENNRWEAFPLFQFIRSLYVNFFYKTYTERFEQRLSHDMHHLYHTLEQYFNVYRHYRPVSKVPSFASTS
jgi:hypothetical protein